MAVSVENDRISAFNDLSSRFSQLMYGRADGNKAQLHKLLDELNFLDYRYPVVRNASKAVLLIHQCFSVIPPDDSDLVAKFCMLVTNLVSRQHVQIEGQTLIMGVQWCLQAASQHPTGVVAVEVLVAFNALLRSNLQNVHLLLQMAVHDKSPIVVQARNKSCPSVVLPAVQCLEACTAVPDNIKSKSPQTSVPASLTTCADIFIRYLAQHQPEGFDNLFHSKLLMLCLRGLQNVIMQLPAFLSKELGLLIGICKTYMVHGLDGIGFTLPQKITPSVLNIVEPPTSIPKEKKGGKITKQRKHRVPLLNKKTTRKSDVYEELMLERQLPGYVPASATLDISYDTLSTQSATRLKTSDSDFSDSETGRAARLGILQGRVRQAALGSLLHIIKLTDKDVNFRYWLSFIPDGSATSVQNLGTCILKDPSPKGRMAALNALLALLSSSKFHLSLAESSEKYGAYTAFSVILGATVVHLHKCLILALNENSIPVLTQVLKCLGALVQATPYAKLQAELITKVMRSVKVYIKHRDATVQVAALIVLGCILASEPVVPETKKALLKIKAGQAPEKTQKESDNSKDSNTSNSLGDSLEYVDFSSEDEESPDSCSDEMPWLLQACVGNLDGSISNQKVAENVPTPVKLESLQVISAMTRNYFESLMIEHLGAVAKALHNCLTDSYADLRLHAGRAVDSIGQALNQYLSTLDSPKNSAFKKGCAFWQALVFNSVAPLLECEQHSALRAVGCDCLGSVGPHIFEHFPRDKQILLVTMLFTCTRDEENCVKGAAVRALAISVLYPSLLEDTGFLVDVAEVVYRMLNDENVMVRTKASWSLGNLSKALVLIALNPSAEDVPESLLLRLLHITIDVARDNDKIKVNAVRALGNLLQLVTNDLMNETKFKEEVERAIETLIKSCMMGTNMKVRWNSCYAIGSTLKNPFLYPTDAQKSTLFSSLSELMKSCKNFKVRITAAAALASPRSRSEYGQHFYFIWNSLLDALENARNVVDFSEYNHRDHLVEQICLTLGHLTTLLTSDDFPYVIDKSFNLEWLKLQMTRVVEHVIPEKSSVLLAAAVHLNDLAASHDLSKESSVALKCLQDIFTNDFVCTN